MRDKAYMVFDVESVGLHGEGYAVGWVVVDTEGNRLSEGAFACDPDLAHGDAAGHKWVRDNAPKLRRTHDSTWQMRAAFWREWRAVADAGGVLVADCGWPVEARFLAACVDDDPRGRNWAGPYPMHELASVLLATGKDTTEKTARLAEEQPEHDPLADAKQSARILLTALLGPARHKTGIAP